MAQVSVLGAGRMGAALVTAFIKAGHSVTVWNRTASKCKPLEALGAKSATSVVEAVTGRDLVVDVVSNYETSSTLLASAEVIEALRGGTLVELASGTPSQAQRRAAWAKEHGAHYLDGAILATPDFIAQPGSTILYSGPEELYEKHQSTLAALAESNLYVGSAIGHANTLDNAILVVLWGSTHGLLQGASICEAEKFPLEAFGKALQSSWSVVEAILRDTLQRIEKRHYDADETSAATVSTCQASVHHILEVSKEHRIDLGLPQALERIFQRAVDRGHGQSDVAAVYESMR